MHQRSKIVLAALASALVLGAATGVAQARRFEVSNRAIRIIWTELIYNGGGQEIRCPVTYEGSFHSRTISKVSGSLVGYIYNASIGSCSGGGVERYLTETLPWHVQYNSFTGTLPNISTVTLAVIGLSWRVERIAAFGSGCLFRSTQARPLFGVVSLEAGRVTRWHENETSIIPFSSGEILCPSEIAFGEGSGSMTAQEGAALTIRLVA
jgi:hypothetical protein